VRQKATDLLARLLRERQPPSRSDRAAGGYTRLETIGISLQVDLFVLQAAPQPLDEDIV
jgi:hypothetical protein